MNPFIMILLVFSCFGMLIGLAQVIDPYSTFRVKIKKLRFAKEPDFTKKFQDMKPLPVKPPKVKICKALLQADGDYQWTWSVMSFAKRAYQDSYYQVTQHTKDFKIALHLAQEAVVRQEKMYNKELLEWKPEYKAIDNWEY